MPIAYFSHGRLALLAGLEDLNLKPGTEILLPDYLCSVVSEVLIFLGLIPVYYSVNSNFTVDWTTVYSAFSRNTKGFILVHYFGIAGELAQAKDFCDKNNLRLIEDNAHGFGATYEGIPLGTLGDIGISSPRKVLSVPNGAILYGARSARAIKGNNASQIRWALRRFIKVCMLKTGAYYKVRRMPDFNAIDLLDESVELRGSQGISESTIRQIEVINQESLRMGRQHAWHAINEVLAKTDYPVQKKITSGSSPLCFPIHLPFIEGDKEFMEDAWKAGLEIYRWPSLPKSVAIKNGNAVRLFRSYAFIKIENNLKKRSIDSLSKLVEKFKFRAN